MGVGRKRDLKSALKQESFSAGFLSDQDNAPNSPPTQGEDRKQRSSEVLVDAISPTILKPQPNRLSFNPPSTFPPNPFQSFSG